MTTPDPRQSASRVKVTIYLDGRPGGTWVARAYDDENDRHIWSSEGATSPRQALEEVIPAIEHGEPHQPGCLPPLSPASLPGDEGGAGGAVTPPAPGGHRASAVADGFTHTCRAKGER